MGTEGAGWVSKLRAQKTLGGFQSYWHSRPWVGSKLRVQKTLGGFQSYGHRSRWVGFKASDTVDAGWVSKLRAQKTLGGRMEGGGGG